MFRIVRLLSAASSMAAVTFLLGCSHVGAGPNKPTPVVNPNHWAIKDGGASAYLKFRGVCEKAQMGGVDYPKCGNHVEVFEFSNRRTLFHFPFYALSVEIVAKFEGGPLKTTGSSSESKLDHIYAGKRLRGTGACRVTGNWDAIRCTGTDALTAQRWDFRFSPNGNPSEYVVSGQ
jgi:hypothetical protein